MSRVAIPLTLVLFFARLILGAFADAHLLSRIVGLTKATFNAG